MTPDTPQASTERVFEIQRPDQGRERYVRDPETAARWKSRGAKVREFIPADTQSLREAELEILRDSSVMLARAVRADPLHDASEEALRLADGLNAIWIRLNTERNR